MKNYKKEIQKNDKQMTGTNDRTKKTRQNQMTKKRQSKRQNKYFHVLQCVAASAF